MWWGGFAIGPRYLLPALPFLAIPVIFTLLCFRKIAWFKVLFTLSLLWSFLATWGLALAGQAFPSDVIREPFFEYAIPAWSQGDIARNFGYLLNLRGAWSLLPLFAILFILILGWVRWSKKHSPGISSEPGRSVPLSSDMGDV
jgi:branched-subunit amino acid ABC-type transport system permease component